jgi:CRISPR-associated protein Cas8c/Csd1 subtype I-C
MIAELLDLADRLEIPTPRAFDPMPVHYFIDLDASGQILAITPAYRGTTEKGGEPELGKEIECPAYFPLAVGPNGEIQASGGGGKSVAEAGHGDVREIFCTDIKAPKGKPPSISLIEPPKGGNGETPQTENEVEMDGDQQDESEAEDDSESTSKSPKNQHYRHAGWLKLINNFIEAEDYRDLPVSKALQKFIAAKPRLTDSTIIGLFSLPDPAKAEAEEQTPDKKKKAKDAASKSRNAKLKQIAGARFTFRVNGELLLKNRDFRMWWDKAYADQRASVLQKLPKAPDGFSARDDEGSSRLTSVFPHIPGIPGGGTYCPLASFDKATTQSFGLGKHTLSMTLTTAERAAGALKWLLRDKGHNCSLGKKLVAVFWAVPSDKNAKLCPHDFATLMNEPDALQVLDFFKNIHGHAATAPSAAQFYCAILSSPKSRITVRGWHTRTLGRVTESAEAYFRTISLPNIFRSGELTASTIGEMAAATVPPKGKSSPPSTVYSRILQTALFGERLPHSFLESALARQALELAKGCPDKKERNDFETRLRARTALIKLYFYSNHKEPKDKPMNEQHHATQDHPAYLCGRVLALLDKIHNAAHGKSTASSPAGRYYGSASSTPALVFPRLCKLANLHLEKIGGGLAYKLQHGVPKEKSETPIERDFEGLAQLIARFSADAKWPRTLSLEDQGRFAIGFYYEKCRKWPRYRKGTNPKGDETGDDESQATDTEDSKQS